MNVEFIIRNKKAVAIGKKMLVAFLVLLVLAACLFVYAYFNGRSGMHPNPEPQEGDIRIACVGDSITYGSTVSNWPENNYPVLLDNYLGDGYTVHNYGISGGCLLSSADKPYHSTRVYPDSIAFNPDVVVIMLGTNDSKTNNWTDGADYKTQLIAFIEEYSNLSTSPDIYLCTPCKAYSSAFSIQEDQVAEIVSIIRDVAADKNIPLIDIRTLSESHPEWFAKDGIHPNNDGAAAIAGAVCDAITGSYK